MSPSQPPALPTKALAGSGAEGWPMWTLHTCALRTARGHVYWRAGTHIPCPKMASISVVRTALSKESGSPGPAYLWPSLPVKVVQGLSPLFADTV